MIVPDINLLIYAYNVDAPASDAAQDWWKKLLSGTETVGVPWAVATGFVRIITNPRVMDSPLPLETAADRVQGWFDYDHVTPLNPGDRHLALFRRNLDVEGSGSNSVTDAHIPHGTERRAHPRDRTSGPLEAGRRHGRPLHPRRDRRVGPPVFIIDVWHLFGEVVRRFSRVDVGLTGVGEYQEAAVQVQVDAGRLGVIVVNDDVPFGSLLTNGAVTECH